MQAEIHARECNIFFPKIGLGKVGGGGGGGGGEHIFFEHWEHLLTLIQNIHTSEIEDGEIEIIPKNGLTGNQD